MNNTCKRMTVIAVALDKYDVVLEEARNTPNGRCKNIVGGCSCTHAEVNLMDKLESLGRTEEAHTIMISHSPCLSCARSLYDRLPGLKRILYREEYRKRDGIEFLIDKGLEIERVED